MAENNDDQLYKKFQTSALLSFKSDISFIYTSDSTFFTLACNSKQVSELVEAVVRKCSVKTLFLEISLNLQETTCARVYF